MLEPIEDPRLKPVSEEEMVVLSKRAQQDIRYHKHDDGKKEEAQSLTAHDDSHQDNSVPA